MATRVTFLLPRGIVNNTTNISLGWAMEKERVITMPRCELYVVYVASILVNKIVGTIPINMA